MRPPIDPQQFLWFLINRGQQWIASQRELHRPYASALSGDEVSALLTFFDQDTLASTRTRTVSLIENPQFYAELNSMGINPPLDFRIMSGITFVDTILVSKGYPAPIPISLLFHELVHVVQYRLLGLDEFVKRYVFGWAQNGMNYFTIPLERDAHELQERYETSPRVGFRVIDEVRRQLNPP